MHALDPNRRLRLLGWALNGLGALVAFAILAAAQLVAYRPLDSRLAACARKTAELDRLLSRENEFRREHARLERDLTAARDQAALLKDRIPVEPREMEFLEQVSDLAGGSRLDIEDYRPGAMVSRGAYSTMRVDLACRGNHQGICGLVDGLRALPRHSTMSRLEIHAPERNEPYLVNMALGLYVANPVGSAARSE